jgi:hypothetical protein
VTVTNIVLWDVIICSLQKLGDISEENITSAFREKE